MTRTNQTGHVRARYGMCLNDQCSKAKAKEVQEISARKEFVCEECGKPLRECPPPPPPTNWLKIVLIVVVVAALGGGGWYFISSQGDKPPVEVNDGPTTDSIAAVDTTAVSTGGSETKDPVETTGEGEQVTKVIDGRGTVDLGYGTYTGDLKNGKPHGYGVITYKTSHKIVSSKDFVANPGDTFEGEFRDGRISGLGYWKHDGNETAVKP